MQLSDAKEALSIAKANQHTTPEQNDPHDTQGLQTGMQISVRPDIDGGEVFVTGAAHHISSDTIGLLRESPETGTVCVNFPRVGYRVDIV